MIIIFALIFSAILSMFLTPIFYFLFERFVNIIGIIIEFCLSKSPSTIRIAKQVRENRIQSLNESCNKGYSCIYVSDIVQNIGKLCKLQFSKGSIKNIEKVKKLQTRNKKILVENTFEIINRPFNKLVKAGSKKCSHLLALYRRLQRGATQRKENHIQQSSIVY
jgi:hypothetical protein